MSLFAREFPTKDTRTMNSNVNPLPERFKPEAKAAAAFADLTDAIVLAQAEAGTLHPGVVAALLLSVRQGDREGGR